MLKEKIKSLSNENLVLFLFVITIVNLIALGIQVVLKLSYFLHYFLNA